MSHLKVATAKGSFDPDAYGKRRSIQMGRPRQSSVVRHGPFDGNGTLQARRMMTNSAILGNPSEGRLAMSIPLAACRCGFVPVLTVILFVIPWDCQAQANIASACALDMR
jgi:hypothetical protein